MLSLKWKATSLKQAISSVYEESFTPDYFYNNHNQTLDSCLSKAAWLFQATDEFINVLHKIGDANDKNSFEQPESLAKILKYFYAGNELAKKGEMYSIVQS